MLSSQTPTIVAKDGKVVLVTGSPGSRTIINTVLCMVVNVVDFDMDVRAAVDAPRLHHQWFPDEATLRGGLATTRTRSRNCGRWATRIGRRPAGRRPFDLGRSEDGNVLRRRGQADQRQSGGILIFDLTPDYLPCPLARAADQKVCPPTYRLTCLLDDHTKASPTGISPGRNVMSYVDVMIPLVCGIIALVVPIRPKNADEPLEAVAKRRLLTRLCGVGAIGVAGMYFLIKMASQR